MSRIGLARIAARVLWVSAVVLLVIGGLHRTVEWMFLIAGCGELAAFCAEDPERLYGRLGRADVAKALLGASVILAVGIVGMALLP